MIIPFVEAVNVGNKQRPTAILLRSSNTTGDKGAAHAIAQAWHNPYNKIESCHYVVDEGQTINCLPVSRASFPLDGVQYKNAITIDVCFEPPNIPSPEVINRMFDLITNLCIEHNLKSRLLTDREISKWEKHRWKRRGGIILKRTDSYQVYSSNILTQLLENAWDSTIE